MAGSHSAAGQRLSEAVVGGEVPRRLAQQTVSGVLQQLGLLGKGCELGAEGDAVAVEAVGGGSGGGLGQAGQQSGPLGDDRAVRERD